ncbi:MAG: hypothetical protein MZU91_07310 [Desulfosudis oleivorans]|nr:hypothetical protein [Desulfosudis oleivorans]
MLKNQHEMPGLTGQPAAMIRLRSRNGMKPVVRTAPPEKFHALSEYYRKYGRSCQYARPASRERVKAAHQGVGTKHQAVGQGARRFGRRSTWTDE